MRRNKKKSPNAVGKHGQHTMGAQASASFDRESPTPHASHAAASFGDGETPGPAQNPYSRRVTQAEYTKKRKSKKHAIGTGDAAGALGSGAGTAAAEARATGDAVAAKRPDAVEGTGITPEQMSSL